jgi:hypothetical protein
MTDEISLGEKVNRKQGIKKLKNLNKAKPQVKQLSAAKEKKDRVKMHVKMQNNNAQK